MNVPEGCRQCRESMPLFLYGELSFDEEDALESHLDGCDACRAELAAEKRFHQSFHEAETGFDLELLRECRQMIGARVSAASAGTSVYARLRELFSIRVHLPTAAQPFGALALVAMGFFGARMLPPGPLGGMVAANLTEPLASRVRYVEPDAEGKIQIVVEETRQRTFTGSMNDERIQRLLLSAAQDPADSGLRVESMDLLKSRPEMTEIRGALLAALRNDPNPGVRLKALEGLKGSAADPEVRQTLSRVLLSDRNPGVRTQVIDLFIQEKRQPQTVSLLQELMRREDNGYIRMRCQKALHEMKASVDPF